MRWWEGTDREDTNLLCGGGKVLTGKTLTCCAVVGRRVSQVTHMMRLLGLAVPHSVHTSRSDSLMLAIGWFWTGIGPSHTTHVSVLNGTIDLQYTHIPICHNGDSNVNTHFNTR